MHWMVLTFGKHSGKTLPQVVLSDPDWFFWAIERDGLFNGRLAKEAEDLAEKATLIKPAKSDPENWEVEYYYERDDTFSGFGFVVAGELGYQKSHVALRLPYLDLSWVCRRKKYDKRGCRAIINDFRRHYFGKHTRLTKRRCENFFSDKRNFYD